MATFQPDTFDLNTVTQQILLALGDALGLIESTDLATETTLDQLERLTAETRQNIFVLAYENNIDLTPQTIKVILINILQQWDYGAHRIFPIMSYIQTQWPESISEKHSLASRILHDSLTIAEAMASITSTNTYNHTAVRTVAENLYQLTQLLLDIDQPQRAFQAALGALNIVVKLPPIERDPFSRLTLTIAQRIGQTDAVSMIAAQRFDILMSLAMVDAKYKAEAFDVYELILRHLPTDGFLRQQLLTNLWHWQQKVPFVRPLLPLVVAELPQEIHSQIGADLQVDMIGLRAATNVVWNESRNDWLQYASYIRDFNIEVENHRLNLRPEAATGMALASWTQWTIDLSNLRRALPHSESLTRDQNLDELLLVMSHEITHIYSMISAIGFASLAMRWALVEIEVELGSLNYEGQVDFASVYFHQLRGLAPLSKAEPSSLARAEQAIEITRKIQIWESAWTHWFEGLAIFIELHGDPSSDPIAFTPITGVIYNLVDRSLQNLAAKAGITRVEAAKQQIALAEATYTKALERISHLRLRNYVIRSDEYLPGYCIVRSVIAAWRKTLGRGLTGGEAGRLLLNMTSYGTREVVPDLSLPADQFEEEVIALQEQWFRQIIRISSDDLEQALLSFAGSKDSDTGIYWESGKLHFVENEEDAQETGGQIVIKYTKQVLQTLQGEYAPLDRVKNADEMTNILITHAAVALSHAGTELNFMSEDFANAILRRQLILPFGRAECPFWILPEAHAFACLIRTTEQDYQHGKPGYDLAYVPIDKPKLEQLMEMVRTNGNPRMTVTRVVDLAPLTLDDNGAIVRGNGMNLIVFQYEDWYHLQVRGLLMGLSEIDPNLQDDIILRLNPNTTIEIYEWLTDEALRGVRRTQEWIESIDDWAIRSNDLNFFADMRPWAQHVLQRAHVVLNHRREDINRDVARRLYHFIFGEEELVDKLMTDGFDALRLEDPTLLRTFLRMLNESGRSPIEDNDFEETNNQIGDILGILMQKTSFGWDFVPPSKK